MLIFSVSALIFGRALIYLGGRSYIWTSAYIFRRALIYSNERSYISVGAHKTRLTAHIRQTSAHKTRITLIKPDYRSYIKASAHISFVSAHIISQNMSIVLNPYLNSNRNDIFPFVFIIFNNNVNSIHFMN